MFFYYFFSLWEEVGAKILLPKHLLPNSEVLADTVQKDILSLLIPFSIEQVIREFQYLILPTFLLTIRGGR